MYLPYTTLQSHSWIFTQGELKCTFMQKPVCMFMEASFVNASWKQCTQPVSRQTMVHAKDRISLSNKEQITDTCNTGKNLKCIMPGKRNQTRKSTLYIYGFTYMTFLTKLQTEETSKWLPGAWAGVCDYM